MIIIIEGPDGSGKTTLAKQIADQTKYPIVKRNKPETEEERLGMLEDYLQIIKSGKNVIFDRCWYSEIVYGTVMRDESMITYHDMYGLEKAAAKSGALIIMCGGPTEALWKRCRTRGEDYITQKEDFVNICKGFQELVDIPHYIPLLRYEAPVV